jgi:hypothetical protein
LLAKDVPTKGHVMRRREQDGTNARHRAVPRLADQRPEDVERLLSLDDRLDVNGGVPKHSDRPTPRRALD